MENTGCSWCGRMQWLAHTNAHTHLQSGWCVSFLVMCSCCSIRLCDEASLMWSQSEAANPLTASMATVHFPTLFSNYRPREAPPPPTLLRQGPVSTTCICIHQSVQNEIGTPLAKDIVELVKIGQCLRRTRPVLEGKCLQGLLLFVSLRPLTCWHRGKTLSCH